MNPRFPTLYEALFDPFGRLAGFNADYNAVRGADGLWTVRDLLGDDIIASGITAADAPHAIDIALERAGLVS